MLSNYTSLKEKMNMPEGQEAQTLQLCKQLLETAEACEVKRKIYFKMPKKSGFS